MFNIINNKQIKISRGDDSGRFPLFLNKGTHLTPIRYQAESDIIVTVSFSNWGFRGTDEIEYDDSVPTKQDLINYYSPAIKVGYTVKVVQDESRAKRTTYYTYTEKLVEVDDDKFKKVVQKNGLYSFYFKQYYWYLKGNIIRLDDYGIKMVGLPENEDTINVKYDSNQIEVYFYIFHRNGGADDFLVKKTFSTSGLITTQYKHKAPRKEYVDNIINENGDMMLQIDSEDTKDFQHGEYLYMVQVKVPDPETHKPVLNTITNKIPFYILDDEFDRGR